MPVRPGSLVKQGVWLWKVLCSTLHYDLFIKNLWTHASTFQRLAMFNNFGFQDIVIELPAVESYFRVEHLCSLLLVQLALNLESILNLPD